MNNPVEITVLPGIKEDKITSKTCVWELTPFLALTANRDLLVQGETELQVRLRKANGTDDAEWDTSTWLPLRERFSQVTRRVTNGVWHFGYRFRANGSAMSEWADVVCEVEAVYHYSMTPVADAADQAPPIKPDVVDRESSMTPAADAADQATDTKPDVISKWAATVLTTPFALRWAIPLAKKLLGYATAYFSNGD